MTATPGRRATALITALLLAACATPPVVQPPTTTVVLLPDEEGNVGAVSLSTDGGSQSIDTAYAYATTGGARTRPSDVLPMGEDAMNAKYAGLLGSQPPKPRSFILHFLLDRAVLTDESKAMLPAVLKAVRERKPTEITIFGHADAIGTEKHNVKLSAERAKTIATILRKDDPTLDRIDVQYFGDKVPLVGSGNRAEPRNRRAEVMIL